jgi:hypothetical protein
LKILLDQGVPAPLRHAFPEHEIITAFERGWQTLQNGDLLRAAEADGFIAFITTDQNIRYQRNLADCNLSIVVLMTTDWRLIRLHLGYVQQAITALAPGAYVELPFPPR